MPGFLAVIWNADNARATSAARDISATPELRGEPYFQAMDDGAYLFTLSHPQDSAGIVPCGRNSAVYGTFFRRSLSLVASTPVRQFSESEEAAIARSEGQFLLAGFWGTYVGIIETRNGYRILSDPCSSLPCFYMTSGNIAYLYSHLERCPPQLRKGLKVNQHFISRLLTYDKIQSGETGLDGVNELQAGHSLRLERGVFDLELSWDPRLVAQAARLNSVMEAAAALKDVTKYVVACRTNAERGTVLSLSGGLDSAIVAAALRTSVPAAEVKALHLVPGGGDPSEASFARRMAGELRIALIEHALDPALALPSPDDCPASARPQREFTGLPQQMLINELPGLQGRTIFTGQGGDHLFQEVRTPLAFADTILLRGLSRDILHQLQCAARLSRTSVWSVLQEALPTLFVRPDCEWRFIREIERRQVLANQPVLAGPDGSGLLPSWALDGDGLPPAKAAQVSSLAHMFQIRSSLQPSGTPLMVHPLISLPLIEFCLRTPVHILCAGGVPRGLVRLAAEGMVPDLVRLRRAKGDASRFYVEQLAANRERLCDVLLEGELVRGGYIEPEDMRACVQPEALRIQTFGRTALVFYAIECWLRRWKSESLAV
jgi:asparagine synthase (glutamine-hydrolysing)